MRLSLFDIIKRDAKRHINSGGYQIDIEVFSPDKTISAVIKGWGVKHALSFDSDGNQVNTKISRVTLDEDDLTANGFTVRNARGEVDLLKYKIKFKDSSGEVRSYSVRENMPDQNLGIIMLILNDAII